MNPRAGRFKGPLIGASLFFLTALFLGFACSNDTVNPTLVKQPGPPTLDTLFIATRNDTEACVHIEFSDTNQLEVSFNAYRARGDSASLPVERGQGIPEVYHQEIRSGDTLQLLWFNDVSLFQGLVLKNDFETFAYRLAAVSRQDSVSPFSNVDTLRLARPAEIDSVPLWKGYPEVYYSIGGQMGTEWDVEVTLGDSLVSPSARIHHNQTFTTFFGIAAFTNLAIDSLKARAQRDSLNGTYGVRILSRVGDSHGIAVSKFNVLP